MNWFPDRERRLHNQPPLPNDGAGLNAAFLEIERSLLQAERSHRLRLQAEHKRACQLLLDAILALDAGLVDERLQADPRYLEQLDVEGWAGLLAEAKQATSRRRAAPARRQETHPPLPISPPPASSGSHPAMPTLPSRPTPSSFAEGDPWLLPDTVPLPDLPAKPPAAYADIFMGASWPKRGAFLALVSLTGWSSQGLLVRVLSRRLGLSTNTVVAAPRALVGASLLEYKVFVTRCGNLGLLELSPSGHKVVRDLGWTAAPSEWQRLRQVLGAGKEEQMAQLVNLGAEVRERGFGAWVCPRPCHGDPDLLVRTGEGEETALFLELDPAQARVQAWQTAAAERGWVGLCAVDPEGRDALVRLAFAAGLAGRATDLATLRAGLQQTLWAEQWLGGRMQQEGQA